MGNTKESIYTPLRKLITEGFKEYDGDIREEALEQLQAIEDINNTIKSQFAEQAKDIDDAYKQIKKLEEDKASYQAETISLNNMLHIVDFGTARLHFYIEKGGAITLNEFMQALQEAAMVTPLHKLTRAIQAI